VPSGERVFCVEKNGFFRKCETLFVPIFGEILWRPTLQKIPEIADAPPKKSEKFADDFSEKFQNVPTVRTPFGRFFAFLPATGNLIFFENAEKSVVVAHFETEKIPKLFAVGEKLFADFGGEIFFIDPDARRKFRIFSGKNPKIKTFETFFLLDDAGEKWIFSAPDFTPKSFPIAADFSKIAFCQNHFFVFENGDFFKISPENFARKKIAAAKISGDFSLLCGPERRSLTILFSDGAQKILRF